VSINQTLYPTLLIRYSSADPRSCLLQALRRYGTDFTLIQLLFSDRSRDQIRNKFKKEEKENGPRIDLALRSRLPIGKPFRVLSTLDRSLTRGFLRVCVGVNRGERAQTASGSS
jgi:hypothetical protein